MHFDFLIPICTFLIPLEGRSIVLKKIYVMIGNYGSGKSELALNFAFKAAETGKTELIDLDLVNTYFRLTERGKLVEQKEIRLISPNYACSGVETLSLPAEVASAFAMNWDTVVFDVGGDAVGSTALGRYYEDFQDFMAMGPEQLEVLNVVNIRRPLAGTVEKIIDLQQQMEIHSHLKITGMINNTNLATMTTPAELRDGYEMLREVSDRTGVPGHVHDRQEGDARHFPCRGSRPEVYRQTRRHRHHHEARLGELYPQLCRRRNRRNPLLRFT